MWQMSDKLFPIILSNICSYLGYLAFCAFNHILWSFVFNFAFLISTSKHIKDKSDNQGRHSIHLLCPIRMFPTRQHNASYCINSLLGNNRLGSTVKKMYKYTEIEILQKLWYLCLKSLYIKNIYVQVSIRTRNLRTS